jgi:excisionase family DNA binding protein
MAYGMAMGAEDELLTSEQVAGMLAMSPMTVRRLRMSGEGPPFIRVGKRAIRYRRGDVEAWLRRRPKK